MNKLIYPKISYELVGLAYRVYNELGFGYREDYYQRAYEVLLKEEDYVYQKELPIELKFHDNYIGNYKLDFLIEDKVVIELKVGEHFYKKNFEQIKEYLLASDKKLGILILFSKSEVRTKRILNL